MFGKTDWIGLLKCAGNPNAFMSVNPVSPVFGDEKDRWIRPLGRARGDGPGCGLCLRNAVFPSYISLEVAAKSFVSRRCSNFIFPAPISCLGERYPSSR